MHKNYFIDFCNVFFQYIWRRFYFLQKFRKSYIYIIGSDSSVSERIIALDFSEKFLVKNLTDKNVYELAMDV